jgi:hypothetical protein
MSLRPSLLVDTGTPSITKSGCPVPLNELWPRIVMSAPAPGRPLPLTIVRPGDWPASACIRFGSGIFSSWDELIVVVA